jgi:hypothetical protein
MQASYVIKVPMTAAMLKAMIKDTQHFLPTVLA